MPASSTVFSDARPPVSLPAFLRSVMPALDRAFGLEVDPDLPDALAALIARLQEEPEAMFAVLSEPEPMAA
ncbi:hypothetical protein ASG52_21950 [Methylobacterium sp. Leaf456]|uniref:hypothetical protein n=1 Tax=Methylobacterium sp. Leaf456 TaxID=1736382 RepID=UPI0006FF44B7|nr:hypothetical protein [Methylobacterium sp. Leaf456]KQT58509.1 hypothetical protein ASG52_21950 [Methylobacterium sp. Leaf456]